MKVGSLFSGIGGFDLGLERAGMEVRWQCEIDANAQSVLRRRFPDAALYDDVTTLGGDVERVDLICGGFPCQDLSVAGRRAGLAGKRSGLFYEFMRIADECAPAWVLIENVPGLLSSNGGRDMGAVLGTLGKLGYGWAYRVLDAQYLGVAQRRRRVFIVGCLGDAARAAQVLFEPESCAGDPPPSREAGARVTQSLTGNASSSSCGNPDDNRAQAGFLVPAVPPALVRRHAKGADSDATDCLIAQALKAHHYGQGPEFNYVAHSLTAEGHDASEDGTERGTPLVAFSCKDYAQDAGGLAPTLRSMNNVGGNANGGGQLAVAFTERTRTEGRTFECQEELSYALTNPGAGGRSHCRSTAQGMSVRRLTPTECERLQGFPDGWTEGQSDSARYRQLGNAVCVPVARWIGRRIMEVAE